MTEQDWWDILHLDASQLPVACDWFEEHQHCASPALNYCRDHSKFPLWEAAGGWYEERDQLTIIEQTTLAASDGCVYAWFYTDSVYINKIVRGLPGAWDCELPYPLWKQLKGYKLGTTSEYNDYLTLRAAMEDLSRVLLLTTNRSIIGVRRT